MSDQDKRLPTEDEALEAAGVLAAEQWLARQSMTSREQAEAAVTPGGPHVDDLEDLIRIDRGLDPIDRTKR